MKRDITPDDEANRFKKLFDEKGVNAFKFRVGSECGRGLMNGKEERLVSKNNKFYSDKSVIKMVTCKQLL